MLVSFRTTFFTPLTFPGIQVKAIDGGFDTALKVGVAHLVDFLRNLGKSKKKLTKKHGNFIFGN